MALGTWERFYLGIAIICILLIVEGGSQKGQGTIEAGR